MAAPAVALALVLACASAAHAQSIPPGQEGLAAAMLGQGGGLPGGCTWMGTNIERDALVARYTCPPAASARPAGAAGSAAPGAATFVVTLRAASSAAPLAGQERLASTREFALLAPPDARPPPELTAELERRIRAREAAWKWLSERVDPASPARAEPGAVRHHTVRTPFRAVVALVLLAIVGAGSALLLLRPLRRRRDRAAAGEESVREHRSAAPRTEGPLPPLAGVLGVVALVSVGVHLGRLRIAFDDYRYLDRALHNPWNWDEVLRFFSLTCLFRAAVLLDPGGSDLFRLANGFALGTVVVCSVVALRRLGFSRAETALAAALFALNPAVPDLLRRGSGIENLSVAAALVAMLLCLIPVARHAEGGPEPLGVRVGRVGLVLAVAALGVFLKYPFMLAAAPAAWIFWRACSTAALAGHLVPGAIGAVVVLLVVVCLDHGEHWTWAPAATPARSLEYLGQYLSALRPRTKVLTDVLTVTVAWHAVVAALPLDGGAPARTWGSLRATAAAVLRGVSACTGAWPLWAVTLSLALVFVAPTLLSRHSERYYVYLAALPLAVLAARVLYAAGATTLPRPLQVALALALVPWGDLRAPDPRAWFERAEPWFREVPSHLEPWRRPEPERVVLVSDCGSPDRDAASDASARELYRLGGDSAIRWATGWSRVLFVVPPAPHEGTVPRAHAPPSSERRELGPSADPRELRVRHCDGHVRGVTPSL